MNLADVSQFANDMYSAQKVEWVRLLSSLPEDAKLTIFLEELVKSLEEAREPQHTSETREWLKNHFVSLKQDVSAELIDMIEFLEYSMGDYLDEIE